MPDHGDIAFNADLSTGTLTISIRPALTLESGRVSASIGILEFLDRAAVLLLELNSAQRAAVAQRAADRSKFGTREKA
ncbi:MAG: hypothetical protein ABJF01_17580 [bacterium]